MKRESRRFSPSKATQVLAPVVMGLLLLGLLAILVMIGLSVMGLFPVG